MNVDITTNKKTIGTNIYEYMIKNNMKEIEKNVN
jgi:hypothetical protein